MLQLVKKDLGELKLEHAYEINKHEWRAEVVGFYLLFFYKDGMLYVAMDEREDNLRGKLALVAINTNPIERIRFQNILDILSWKCDNYWEGD